MKKFLGLTTAILALLVFSATTRAQSFTVYLNSAQEVPSNASTATGRGRIVLDRTTNMITFTISFTGLSSAQTLSHIHSPAPIGVSTGVSVNFGTVGGTSGTISGTAAVTPTIIGHILSGQAYVNIHSTNFPGGEIRGQIAKNRPVDYDGDGRNDFSVLRFPAVTPPAFGQITYWNLRSTDGSIAQDFGDVSEDFPAPGDYDGDGKGDLALFRHDPNNTVGADTFFLVFRSSNNTLLAVRWGVTGDRPVARDYDGDGITDMAVFRGGANAGDQAYWYIRQSASNNVQLSVPFGITPDSTNAIGDTPVPADYDGDGKFDIAVYRFGGAVPDNTFIVKQSSDSTIKYTTWGNFQSDYILPGDYDGDGKSDYCAARTGAASTSPMDWYILRTSDGGTTVRTFGFSADLPTQGDYDGDGRCDLSVYRRGATATSQSTFHYITSLDNTVRSQIWGLRADYPVNTFDAR